MRRLIFSLTASLVLFLLVCTALVYVGATNYKNLKNGQTSELGSQSNAASPSENVSTTSAITKDNFLIDPSFEEQSDAWYSHENWNTKHTFDSTITKDGKLSALLSLDSRQEGSQSTRVYGVTQDIKPTQFPNFLSGNYYVEDWHKVTDKQYMQVVVIVFGPDNIPNGIQGVGNYQIRYILAGQKKSPLDIVNAKYIILNPNEPTQNKWVHFERDLKKDFKEKWGDIPKQFSSIRVFFEARWDDRDNTTPVSGKVRYDDLFLGIR